MDYGYKPTTMGREILAACMALGAPLELTRVSVGDGKVSEDVNLADMHSLVHYVAEGTIGDRRHEENRLYLTIQYHNNEEHADVGTFLLTEFIVYAKHPAAGKEEDLLYATLGDYCQSVPPYAVGFPPGVWNFPLVLIVSDEINVSVSSPAGLVTYEDLIRLIESSALGATNLDIIIPASGWLPDTDTNGTYPICCDIPVENATEKMVPMVTVWPECMELAEVCKLSPSARTIQGAVRVYAMSEPERPIQASLALLGTSPFISLDGIPGGSSPRALPIASATTLGGVKVQEGSGLVVDGSGNIAIDAAADQDAKSIYDGSKADFGQG